MVAAVQNTTAVRIQILDGAGYDKMTCRDLAAVASELAMWSQTIAKPVARQDGDDAVFTFSGENRWQEVTVPGHTVAQVRAAYVRPAAPCTRCGGDGVYKWGTFTNGRPQFSGTCFRCNGSGKEPQPRNPHREAAPVVEPVETRTETVRIPEGTYTIAYPDGSHKTFRVRSKTFRGVAKTVVEYLSGSDNELDFTAFAFVNEREGKTTLNVWKRFERGSLVNFAREIESTMTSAEAVEGAGLLYAVKSNRCRRCNRVLTVPASIHAGYGPDCLARVQGS